VWLCPASQDVGSVRLKRRTDQRKLAEKADTMEGALGRSSIFSYGQTAEEMAPHYEETVGRFWLSR
jgi:hypothetical protein